MTTSSFPENREIQSEIHQASNTRRYHLHICPRAVGAGQPYLFLTDRFRQDVTGASLVQKSIGFGASFAK